VAVGTEVGFFHRLHPGSETASYEEVPNDLDRAAGETTRMIVSDAESDGIPIRNEWQAAIAAMSATQRAQYRSRALPGARVALAALWGEDVFGVSDRPDVLSRAKKVCRSLCPPFVWSATRRACEILVGWIHGVRSSE